MNALKWSIEHARRYQRYATGLCGRNYAPGDAGIRTCFRDLGTLQLDPLPIMGRNHDLVIQSRVNGTHPGQALHLIHEERLGFEYWDKVLCAIAIDRFPQFRSLMEAGGEPWVRRREVLLEEHHPNALEAVYAAVSDHGPLSSRELKDLDIAQGDQRGWKATKAANVALEVLWNAGRIAVSHRVNFRRYFDLTERIIPETHRTPDTDGDFAAWLLKKRVNTVGLLPVSGSPDAWSFLRRARSDGVPQRLVEQGALVRVEVEGIAPPFYAAATAARDLEVALAAPDEEEARFIAPLDPLVWAREALEKLWAFHYVWEVYKPVEKRIYGYYVLPILVQDRFVGRFDGKYDRAAKTLRVASYHEEPGGMPATAPVIQQGFQRFLDYLHGERVVFPDGTAIERES